MTVLYFNRHITNAEKLVGQNVTQKLGNTFTTIKVNRVSYEDRKCRNSAGTMIPMAQTLLHGDLVKRVI